MESCKPYIATFLALLFFTALTVFVAFHDFGAMNTVLAMGIAIIKATLVILYFMHIRHSTHLLKIFSVLGFVFLAIFLLILTLDYKTRAWDKPKKPSAWIERAETQFATKAEPVSIHH